MIRTLPLVASLALVGCSTVFNSGGSSDYGCPGMPQGVVCKTPATVYKMTNGELPETEFDVPGSADKKDKQSKGTDKTSQPVQKQIIIASGSMVGGPPALMPLREPPKMMRIWFAPWVDKHDAWHSPSFQVVEVQGRKWATGKMEVQASQIVTPYVGQVTTTQVEQPKRGGIPSTATATAKTQPMSAGSTAGSAIDLNAGLPVPSR